MFGNQRAKAPKGVLVISIFLSFIIVFFFLSNATISFSKNVSNEEKLTALQSESFKKRNITTVQQYDEYYKKASRKMPVTKEAVACAVVMAGFIYGLWTLQNWARLGLCFALCVLTSWRVVRLVSEGSLRAAIGFDVLVFLLFISITFYLMHPRVRGLFK